MKTGWYLSLSTSQVRRWFFISSAEPRGQAERVSRGRGRDADLPVTNISCLTVTADAGTLAQAAWRTTRRGNTAARFPFPPWQPGLPRWHSRRRGWSASRTETLIPTVFLQSSCSRCRATSTRCTRLSAHETCTRLFLLPLCFLEVQAVGETMSLSKKQASCHATKEPSPDKLWSNRSHWLTNFFFFSLSLFFFLNLTFFWRDFCSAAVKVSARLMQSTPSQEVLMPSCPRKAWNHKITNNL